MRNHEAEGGLQARPPQRGKTTSPEAEPVEECPGKKEHLTEREGGPSTKRVQPKKGEI